MPPVKQRFPPPPHPRRSGAPEMLLLAFAGLGLDRLPSLLRFIALNGGVFQDQVHGQGQHVLLEPAHGVLQEFHGPVDLRELPIDLLEGSPAATAFARRSLRFFFRSGLYFMVSSTSWPQ